MIGKAFGNPKLARYLPLALGGLLLALPAAASTLTVTGTSAHCGNFGLAVEMDGTNAAWVETDHPSAETRYVVRFYMKVDYATPGGELEVFTAYSSADGNTSTPSLVLTLDASKQLSVQYRTDSGGLQGPIGNHLLAAGWHRIEMDWLAASGTGSLTTTIDDSVDATLGASSLDNDTATINFARWGAVGGTLTGTGFLMLDDFVSQRTGPTPAVPACGTNDALTPENLKFYPITPCRVYYTGWPGQSAGVGGVERVIEIIAGPDENNTCGEALVPADAKALAINITAVSPTSNGNFKVFPDGIAAPTATTMNFLQNVNRANNALVMVSPLVKIRVLPFTVTPSAQVGYAIDIYGYFKKP